MSELLNRRVSFPDGEPGIVTETWTEPRLLRDKDGELIRSAAGRAQYIPGPEYVKIAVDLGDGRQRICWASDVLPPKTIAMSEALMRAEQRLMHYWGMDNDNDTGRVIDDIRSALPS